MSYSTDHLRTAGKITVYTTLIGVCAFALIFIFNVGESNIKHVGAAETATTSVTVLNTAPFWTASTTELIESSTTNPTDAGNTVSWVAVGTDSNGEDYWLLICSTSATPTPNSSAPPTCTSGVQWARSATTTSGTQASAATTTAASWSESNAWFGWICDSNSGTPRCNSSYTQGTNATNSSPFEVNHRPLFDIFTDNSPANPGVAVVFTSSSTDTDVSGTPDTVFLTVCATAGFATTTNTCTGTTLATSTAFVSSNASSTYTIVIPTQDQDYSAFGYVIDQHGFESAGISQNTDSTLTVSNVAPTVSAALISLVQPSVTDIYLTVEEAETTGFALSFTTEDNNSCDSVASTTIVGDEIIDYDLSIYRSGVGSTTCGVGAGSYNANNCYPSGLATTTWNLTCTASTTSCSGSSDTDMIWNCTFPLWYIADPTDGTATSTQYSAQNWRAQVRGVDDGQEGDLISLTGSSTESSSGVDVRSLLAFALRGSLTIAYGSLEPGNQTDPINATTTVAATGNVGVDKDVTGTAMCTTYTGLTPCADSATSTIPAFEQVFGTSTVTYAEGRPISATSTKFVDINVHKSTSTTTATTSNAYWGIRVPGTITFAGDYTGENTFTALVSDSSQW